MLFNSNLFILFFVLVLLVSRIKTVWSIRKGFLLVVSYLFYAAWNPPFVILLWISTVGDWFFAKLIHKSIDNNKRRFYLFLSLLLNLGMLGYFKYANFILDNFISIAHVLGINWQPAPFSIILPVGISFYTFQTLSYTLDVYYKRMAPAKSFLDYALYVTFFPQLVAGPIVRAKDFIPQCLQPKKATFAQLSWGMSLFILGLFYKVVIADGLMSGKVEKGFTFSEAPGFLDAWAAVLCFSTQIFCDFAGYSTCAIGIALCLGFALPDNFRFPYAAIGFSDFWRRWHISLSSWLRDYLYISLGGNRKGAFFTYRNLALTMLLGGLWHGASWTFVIWGALHGIFLVIERFLRSLIPHWRLNTNIFVQLFLGIITYICVCYAWVFFRSDSLNDAWKMIVGMTGFNGLGVYDKLTSFVIPIGLVIFHWFMRNTTEEEVAGRLPWWVKSLILYFLVLAILTYSGEEDRAFIYFQF